MGTLSSELADHAERLSPRPRVYVDANVPAPLVAHMRRALDWDVLWVIEEDSLRRAADLKHYRLSHQLRRTLITMDEDFLDDRRYPPAEGSGVVVIQAPNERELVALIDRLDRTLFRSPDLHAAALPLDGQKLHAHSDWGR
jgi:predicted nuclease of predicted toxin-antitoxin system